MQDSAAVDDAKQAVKDFWERLSCGEVYAAGTDLKTALDAQASERYRLEPYIAAFARFSEGANLDVLEIGVGMGADHLQWARSHPRSLAGIDLTQRAIDFTAERLRASGFRPELRVADAEALPFPDCSFDLVYSWGVLHHSPNTAQAISEAHRVLRPGGRARVMIYHSPSLVGILLWLRYGVRRGLGLRESYARYLESPGTKAYSAAEARELFSAFSSVKMQVKLSFGDLLEGEVGQRHSGMLLRTLKAVWPRTILRIFAQRLGTMLLIEAVK